MNTDTIWLIDLWIFFKYYQPCHQCCCFSPRSNPGFYTAFSFYNFAPLISDSSPDFLLSSTNLIFYKCQLFCRMCLALGFLTKRLSLCTFGKTALKRRCTFSMHRTPGVTWCWCVFLLVLLTTIIWNFAKFWFLIRLLSNFDYCLQYYYH